MEVKWSPNHDDKFYTFGTNLALYKINDIPDDNSAWKEGGECIVYCLCCILVIMCSYRVVGIYFNEQ